MKRTLILSLCLCAVSAIFAQRHDTVVIITKNEAPVEKTAAANDNNAVAACCDQDFNQKTYANDPEEGYYFTKWELGLKAGFNYLNVDPVADGETLAHTDGLSWDAALQLAYNFNDVWAIAGQLDCYAMNRTGLHGYTFGLDLGVRANLTNLVAPHRSELSRRFNVTTTAGLGFSPIYRKYTGAVAAFPESDWELGMYGDAFVALDAEARFNKLVGLFVEAEGRVYFTGAGKEILHSTNVRPMYALNAGIRFHF